MKRHDTRSAVKASLISPKGNAVDLTNANVKFTMVKNGQVLANRAADILNATDGIVAFIFLPEETTTLGPMKAEFEVTYPDGSIETFPNEGYIPIYFEADLA